MRIDTVWRFLRTVGWASVGLVFATGVLIPLLEKVQLNDWIGAEQVVVVGGLAVLTAGLLAIITALIPRFATGTTTIQRAVLQFLQTFAGFLVAPVLADSLFNTAVIYGRSLWSGLLVALSAAVTAYIVNQREASARALTPAPSDTST